jgi:hypothetical protein
MSAKARILAAVTLFVGRGYLLSICKYHAVNPVPGVPEPVEVVDNPLKVPEDNGSF